MVGSNLGSVKAQEEEILNVKKHAVYEKVTMSQCWKETEKNSVKTSGHEQGNVQVSLHKISLGREGTQQWNQAPTCSVQRHLWRE